MEVRRTKGSAVYFIVFYGVFCIGPSKTLVFLLVSAPEDSKSSYFYEISCVAGLQALEGTLKPVVFLLV